MAKILIIDDDDQYRGMVRKILEKEGFSDIEEAADGSIGMKLFRKNPFDLVITDIFMPDKEGIETIMELTRDYPGIKIIGYTLSGAVCSATQQMSVFQQRLRPVADKSSINANYIFNGLIKLIVNNPCKYIYFKNYNKSVG